MKKQVVERVTMTPDKFKELKAHISSLDGKEYADSTLRNYLNYRSTGAKAQRLRHLALTMFDGTRVRTTNIFY